MERGFCLQGVIQRWAPNVRQELYIRMMNSLLYKYSQLLAVNRLYSYPDIPKCTSPPFTFCIPSTESHYNHRETKRICTIANHISEHHHDSTSSSITFSTMTILDIHLYLFVRRPPAPLLHPPYDPLDLFDLFRCCGRRNHCYVKLGLLGLPSVFYKHA